MQKKSVIGWEEWLALPELHLPAIKAKIDTGAKISTLHAVHLEEVVLKKTKYIRFVTYPFINDTRISSEACVPIADKRSIISSNGIKEIRYIVLTTLKIDNKSIKIELSLTDRKQMRFPMLLGREAIKQFAIVDPSQSFCLGKKSAKAMKEFYKGVL